MCFGIFLCNVKHFLQTTTWPLLAGAKRTALQVGWSQVAGGTDMQVDLDRLQPFPNKKKHKNIKNVKSTKSTKIKNTWAPAIITKKQNRVKMQKTKKYKIVKNVKT